MAAYYIFNANTGEKMMIGDDVDLLFVDAEDDASVGLFPDQHPDNDGVIAYHGTFRLFTESDPMALYLTTPTDDFVRLTQEPEVIYNNPLTGPLLSDI